MKTVIIGGGAAGMMCACFCAARGDETVIIEKNEKLGKKLFITGKGRCNVTNDCQPADVLENIVTNPKFMTGAIYSFPPEKVKRFFEDGGVMLKTERGNRVFPVSDKSSDIIKCLEKKLREFGVKVYLNTVVEKIEASDGIIRGVVARGGFIACDKAVVCTGGISYPLTGSTGDGYKFARCVGHTVTPLRAALTGLELTSGECAELSGLTLKNIGFSVKKNGKTLYSDFGELLFTHFGVSGPVVLSASSRIGLRGAEGCDASIDLKPALDEKILDARLLRDFKEYKSKQLKNSLCALMPKSLVPCVLAHADQDGEKTGGDVTAAERRRLLLTLKDLSFPVKGLRPVEEGIVTAGGVSVKEIQPKTMESKLVKGLFFAGEVLDVDALTGGFNLQCAFSSAYAAANAPREIKSVDRSDD